MLFRCIVLELVSRYDENLYVFKESEFKLLRCLDGEPRSSENTKFFEIVLTTSSRFEKSVHLF
jgi:hypothetical protein